MSEANNSWRIELDGKEHSVDLEHTLMDKHTITVDGAVVEEGRNWSFSGMKHEFELAGHPAKIAITRTFGGMGNESSLHVDGAYVEPLRR